MAIAVVAVSDIHIGSTYGIFPKDGIRLDDGSMAYPSKYGLALWECWLDFWTKFVPEATRGADRTYVVVNGDIVDGNGSKSIAMVSPSREVQESAAIKLFQPIVKHVGPTWLVRGTDYHVDVGGQSEERIGRAIGAQTVDDSYSSFQLWLEGEGVTMQFAHHIGVTSSTAYESSAPMREMVAGLIEAGQWGRPLPSLFVRSHRHRYVMVEIPAEDNKVYRCMITPAWQLRTPYVERIDRMRMPHIGGVVIWIDKGYYQTRPKLYRTPMPEIVKLG